MSRFFKILPLVLLLAFFISRMPAIAQEAPTIADTLPDNVILEQQWAIGGMIHTNGWGLKFRRGKSIKALRQWMWEVEYSTYKSAKEIRVLNPYFVDAKSYIYGKLNSVSFLRVGTGMQHILNRKPYWGGVQLSILYYGGLSVGFAKPIYLYILHFNAGYTDYEIEEERYDPAIHFTDNIYGRGSLLAGLLELTFHPGVYIKSGLEFEFGNKNRRPKALEIGGCLDYTPFGIPIMAYNPKQNFFLTLYLSFTFGKRYNKHTK